MTSSVQSDLQHFDPYEESPPIMDNPDITSFYGDFYCVPDNVTRGVCMPVHSASLRQAQVSKSPREIDFYENTFACLEPDRLQNPLPSGQNHMEENPPGTEDLLWAGLGTENDVKSTDTGASLTQSTEITRFPHNAAPPWLPRDQMFSLTSTSIDVHLDASATPAQLGNALLDFFAESRGGDVVAFIQKVRPVKFSVKAQMSLSDLKCCVKARVYRRTGSLYAIEFQRRAGDIVAFNAIFQNAVQFYTERGYLLMGPNNSSSGLADHALTSLAGGFQCPTSPWDPDGLIIDPLLNIAGLKDQPDVQAEAGSALAKVVRDPAGAKALLQHEEGKNAVQNLLLSEDQGTFYSTLQLLLSMLNCQAGDWLADDELWASLLRKVRTNTCSSAVRREMEKVVKAVTNTHTDRLPPQAQEILSYSLPGAGLDECRDLVKMDARQAPVEANLAI